MQSVRLLETLGFRQRKSFGHRAKQSNADVFKAHACLKHYKFVKGKVKSMLQPSMVCSQLSTVLHMTRRLDLDNSSRSSTDFGSSLPCFDLAATVTTDDARNFTAATLWASSIVDKIPGHHRKPIKTNPLRACNDNQEQETSATCSTILHIM